MRRELDDLVDKLNGVIQGAVGDANNEHGSQQVHFVDVGGRYKNHRWCEHGDFHEPAPDRADTWFFLSGWKDVSLDNGVVVSFPTGKIEPYGSTWQRFLTFGLGFCGRAGAGSSRDC